MLSFDDLPRLIPRAPGVRRLGVSSMPWMFLLPILALYVFLPPLNRSEAEDAFDYAFLVQSEPNPATDIHPHHPLYIPLMRGLFLGFRALGLYPDAYGLLRAVSVAAALLCLILLAAILRTAGLPRFHILAATACTAFSYGFWRYAVEAEIYLPALLPLLAALCLGMRPDTRPLHAVLASLCAALAAGMHMLLLPPALVAVPLSMAWRRRRPLLAVLYLLSLAAVLAVGFLWLQSGLQASQYRLIPINTPHSLLAHPMRLATALPAAIHCIASFNFLFAFPAVRRLAAQAFPGRVLDEEFFMGSHTHPALAAAACVTALAVAMTAAILCVRLGTRGKRLPAAARPLAAALAVWLTLHAMIGIAIEPSNPETWILTILPFWALAALVASAEHVGRPPTPDRPALAPAALLLGACLLAHNTIGGILPLRNPDGDYLAVRSIWLREHARPRDTVLIPRLPVFFRYLRYVCPARICYPLDGHASSMSDLLDQTIPPAPSTRLYATADFLRGNPPRSVPAGPVASSFTLVHDDPFGGVFLLTNPPPHVPHTQTIP